MSRGDRCRLEDLPPYYREQAERQIAEQDARQRIAYETTHFTGFPAGGKMPTLIEKKRSSNKKREDGFDSEWEAQYSQELSRQVGAGIIASFEYHAIALIVEGSRYTPDFLIRPKSAGKPIIHEIKGHWRSRDRRIWLQVRNKFARDYDFAIVRKEGGAWIVRDDWTNPPSKKARGEVYP